MELTWSGKIEVQKRAIRAMGGTPRPLPPLPFLIRGDASVVVPELVPSLTGSVALVYLDPPFGTGDSFSYKGRRRKKGAIYEDPSGRERYASMLYPVLAGCHRLLDDEGSIYVHIDHRMEHLVRMLLDEIFGPDRFRGMVVWRRDPGGKGAKARARQWPRNIDVLLWYSKSPTRWRFTMQWRPVTERQAAAYRYRDPDGRRYKAVQLGDYSARSIERLEQLGLIYTSRTGKKYKKYYLDEAKTPVDSIWDDIPGFGTLTASKEYTGYPTQKPLALLNRIIAAHTSEGDVVMDPFMGSGTTAVAAAKMGRRWFGIEASETGISTTLKRLDEADVPRPTVIEWE